MKRQYWIIALLVAFAGLSLALTLPGPKAEVHGVPSSELTRRVTEEGSVRTTDYLDDRGNLTYASNKRYATMVQTRDEDARTVLEQFFDENGEPAVQSQGHCAVLRGYDAANHNTDILYLDADGAPVDIIGGYARIERTYDAAGRLTSEFYYDAADRPALNASDVHGFIREYPDEGGDYRMTYLDVREAPVAVKAGYTALTRQLDGEGRVVEERYYDADGAPCAGSLGEYGVLKDYDADGNNVRLTYLGADGSPAPTRKGYAAIERVFQEGKLVRQNYLDAAGDPVALVRGEYGKVLRDGSWRSIDAQGREMFDLDLYLRGHSARVFGLGLAICLASLLLGRRGNIALLAGYVLFIAYMTLMYRGEVTNRLNLELFWSYRLFFTDLSMRREILFNIWLFVPLGLILYRVSGRPWAALVPLALSAAVELTQYALSIGLCELDDLVSNGLGGGIGWLMGAMFKDIRKDRDHDSQE